MKAGICAPDKSRIEPFLRLAAHSCRLGVTAVFFFPLLFAFPLQDSLPGQERVCVIVTGLGGVPEYEENFLKWGSRLEEIFRDSLDGAVIRLDGRTAGRVDILQVFEELSRRDSASEIWIFLIGHASHDTRAYKFNIRGPDLTDNDLSEALAALGKRKIVLVVATNSSGGVASTLQGPNRVIVAATRNERERQPPLFLSFLIEAAESDQADTDKDGRVSVAEAFRVAENKISGWYEEKGQIQTEHPLLIDGDDQSAPASTFYLSTPPESAYQTEEARLLNQQKREIERQIEELKFRKSQMPESDYYHSLQSLLVELASLNQKMESLEANP